MFLLLLYIFSKVQLRTGIHPYAFSFVGYVKINPIKYIPTLVDGDIGVSDSLAIILVSQSCILNHVCFPLINHLGQFSGAVSLAWLYSLHPTPWICCRLHFGRNCWATKQFGLHIQKEDSSSSCFLEGQLPDLGKTSWSVHEKPCVPSCPS
jgi:hypothetical protein